MNHEFYMIDEDNYERFAALVISDLRCGSLHDAAVSDRKMLIVGETDPLHMTEEQRKNQQISSVMLPGGGV